MCWGWQSGLFHDTLQSISTFLYFLLRVNVSTSFLFGVSYTFLFHGYIGLPRFLFSNGLNFLVKLFSSLTFLRCDRTILDAIVLFLLYSIIFHSFRSWHFFGFLRKRIPTIHLSLNWVFGSYPLCPRFSSAYTRVNTNIVVYNLISTFTPFHLFPIKFFLEA